MQSVTVITDGFANKSASYEYDIYGKIKNKTGSFKNEILYTGRWLDQDTGLHYYRARWYDANSGRFISKDPIGVSGGINLYGYVGGNPVNWGDPTGFKPNGVQRALCRMLSEAIRYGCYLGYCLAKNPCKDISMKWFIDMQKCKKQCDIMAETSYWNCLNRFDDYNDINKKPWFDPDPTSQGRGKRRFPKPPKNIPPKGERQKDIDYYSNPYMFPVPIF